MFPFRLILHFSPYLLFFLTRGSVTPVLESKPYAAQRFGARRRAPKNRAFSPLSHSMAVRPSWFRFHIHSSIGISYTQFVTDTHSLWLIYIVRGSAPPCWFGLHSHILTRISSHEIFVFLANFMYEPRLWYVSHECESRTIYTVRFALHRISY